MDKEAEAMDLPAESGETETSENESDKLEQCESEESPDTLISEIEASSNTLSADEFGDISDEESDDWADVCNKDLSDNLDGDDIYEECMDEDEIRSESMKTQMEQDSNIEEAVPQAPENVQPSQVQSTSKNDEDPAMFKKSPLQSISEESEPAILQAKKGSTPMKSRIPRRISKTPTTTDQRLVLRANKETTQMERVAAVTEFLQTDEVTKMITKILHEKMLQTEQVPGASEEVIVFPPFRITEREEPYIRVIRNWLQKPKPKPLPIRPVASPQIRKAANISEISPKQKTAPVQSIAGVSKQLKQSSPVLPPKKDAKLTPASSKKEITAKVKSDVSEKVELSLILPPKKNPKFTGQVESANDAPTEVTDLAAVSSDQNEDLQNTSSTTNEEPLQQLMPQLFMKLLMEEVESRAEQKKALAESVSEVSEVERIVPTLPVTSDTSIQEDEKTAQEMHLLGSFEECGKAPPVSPRTKFLEATSSTQQQCKMSIHADLMRLNEFARKIQSNEETKTKRPNDAQSNSEQVPPIPRKRSVTKPLPLEKNESNAPVGNAQHDNTEDGGTGILDFPPVLLTVRDIPYIRTISWMRRRTSRPVQKPVKKVRRLPPAALKIKNAAGTCQGPTEKVAEQVEPVSEPSAEAATSISFSSKEPECSLATPESTAFTSTLSKLMSEMAKRQLVPEESKNVPSNSTPRSAEGDWSNFHISDKEFNKFPKAELTLPQAETEPSNGTTITKSNVVLSDEVSSQRASTSKGIPHSPLPFVSHPSESQSFAHLTHNDFCQALSEKQVNIFRAYRENIPEEAYIRDLIGVQVYQWTSCTEEEQPCNMFCAHCKFCCHQFYCTCRPYKLRAVSWCMHIHAATTAQKHEREIVVFVMDTWQMNRPGLVHVRAMCYDLDNLAVVTKNDFFLVKEFSPVRVQVTTGKMKRRCGDCLPSHSCSTCNICRHVYECVCDAFCQGQLCVHCHVVALYQKKIHESMENGESSKRGPGSRGIPQNSNSNGTSTPCSGETRTLASNSHGTSKAASGFGETSTLASNSHGTSKAALGFGEPSTLASNSHGTSKAASGFGETATLASHSDGTSKATSGFGETSTLASNSDGTSKIASGFGETSTLASDCDGTSKKASGSGGTSTLTSDSDRTSKIASGFRGTSTLASDSDGTSKMALGSVETSNMASSKTSNMASNSNGTAASDSCTESGGKSLDISNDRDKKA